jgi:hypothetical protein
MRALAAGLTGRESVDMAINSHGRRNWRWWPFAAYFFFLPAFFLVEALPAGCAAFLPFAELVGVELAALLRPLLNAASQPSEYFWFDPTRTIVTVVHLAIQESY